MRIVQVSTADIGGGAEAVARNLFEGYRQRGHSSRLVVGVKRSSDPDVIELPRATTPRTLTRLAARSFGPRLARAVENPVSAFARLRGSEDVFSPASWSILDAALAGSADILHCHNLHGRSYFDLRALPALARRAPLVLSLHDAWLLAGHCAHSLDCERWLTGCGGCPDLTLYPAIRRDNTAENFARKRSIFEHVRVYLSAPSQWLVDRAKRSHLSSAIIQSRVIPNGVDTLTFAPGDRARARMQLGIPANARVLLFVAVGGARNPWKDSDTLRQSLALLGGHNNAQSTLCLVVGTTGQTEMIGSVEMRYLGRQSDNTQMARVYQAADLYVHPSRADTFPTTILEALACGTPVVGTAVGGITEQILPLETTVGSRVSGAPSVAVESATGVLVPPRDSQSLAVAIALLLDNPSVATQLGVNARRDVDLRFSQEVMVDRWLRWYAEILGG